MSEARRQQLLESRRVEKAQFVQQNMLPQGSMNFGAKPATVPDQMIAGSKPRPPLEYNILTGEVFAVSPKSNSHAVKSQFKEEKNSQAKFNILNWGEKPKFQPPPEPKASDFQHSHGSASAGSGRFETGPFAPTVSNNNNDGSTSARRFAPQPQSLDGWSAIMAAQQIAAEEKMRAEKEREKAKKAATYQALTAQMREHDSRKAAKQAEIDRQKAEIAEQQRKVREDEERTRELHRRKQEEAMKILSSGVQQKHELDRRAAELERQQGEALVARAKLALVVEKEKEAAKRQFQRELAEIQERSNAEGLKIKEQRALEQKHRDEQLAKEYATILEREEVRRKQDLAAMAARQARGEQTAKQGSDELKRVAQAEWERLKSHQDALEAKKAAEEHAKRSKAEEENRRMLETLNMQIERKHVLERQAKEEELIRMQKIRDAAERAEAVERDKKAAAKQSKENYRLQLEQQARANAEIKRREAAGGMSDVEAKLNAKFLAAAQQVLTPRRGDDGGSMFGRAAQSSMNK